MITMTRCTSLLDQHRGAAEQRGACGFGNRLRPVGSAAAVDQTGTLSRAAVDQELELRLRLHPIRLRPERVQARADHPVEQRIEERVSLRPIVWERRRDIRLERKVLEVAAL